MTAGAAQAVCRQALILGLDISGSVDGAEYNLQLHGLASALTSPAVKEMALAAPEVPVHLLVFEWSGVSLQRVLVDWTPLTSEAAIDRIANTLLSTRRISRKGATAIGRAMDYAEYQFRQGPDCWTRTLDLSGDGKNNDGNFPELVRQQPRFNNITINGLVIGSDVSRGRDERQMELMELSAYYRRRVIHGPGAFIEVALGFADYARAMERKLLRELEGLVVGQLD
ncbi:DUF1194 domain-containing protein [Litoreibacter ponti]|nr:DUF1194 domain-containing protein [Litoreibacter ponti]